MDARAEGCAGRGRTAPRARPRRPREFPGPGHRTRFNADLIHSWHPGPELPFRRVRGAPAQPRGGPEIRQKNRRRARGIAQLRSTGTIAGPTSNQRAGLGGPAGYKPGRHPATGPGRTRSAASDSRQPACPTSPFEVSHGLIRGGFAHNHRPPRLLPGAAETTGAAPRNPSGADRSPTGAAGQPGRTTH